MTKQKEKLNLPPGVKPLEELTLMDDYMFGVVMRDIANLKPLLEYILNITIINITFVESQKTEKEGYNSHGIRMDLYVEDSDGRIFNVEVQTTKNKYLPKRMRYYQSVIDIDILTPGDEYKDLKESFVIFICNYDPYKENRYVYTFENRCIQDPDLAFGDETLKVIVNTKGTVGDISDELKEVLVYLDEGKATGIYSKQLDTAVRLVKASEERRHEYMVMKIHEQEIRDEAEKKGIAKGKAEGVDETRLENIKSVMEGLKYSPQQAMDLLKIPTSDQSKYAAML